MMDVVHRDPCRAIESDVFRHGGFRFYFGSHEEMRLYVRVSCEEGEAKFWIQPAIELARNHGMSGRALRSAEALIRIHEHTIRAAWRARYGC